MNQENRDLIRRAQEINQLISQIFGGPHPNSLRWQLVLIHISLVLEHHDSVLTLLSTERNTATAMALLRVVAETACNGCWALKCANEHQIGTMRAGHDLPGTFRERLDQIGAALEANDVFGRVGSSWRYLNSLTHSGFAQFIRRVNQEGDIQPNFTDQDISETIRFASTDLLVLAVPMLVEEGRAPEARRLEQAFIDRFGEENVDEPEPH